MVVFAVSNEHDTKYQNKTELSKIVDFEVLKSFRLDLTHFTLVREKSHFREIPSVSLR